MADPRFYKAEGPFTLEQLAQIGGAEIHQGGDPNLTLVDVAPLNSASEGCISFLDNKKYAADFKATKASACIVAQEVIDQAPKGVSLLIAKEPYRAYAKIAQAFYPRPVTSPGISENATISTDAQIDQTCRVDSGAYIYEGAEIGPRTWVGPNSIVGPGVIIGTDCYIAGNVTILNSLIGDSVTIHSGVRLGQDGFGFAMGPQGHERVPQLGRVIIEDNVDIGANTAIDRGAGPDTVIGAGTKIDNLVQIGHNVKIGRCCVIVSQVGISGSTEIGDFSVLAGQVGVAGHLKIGTGVTLAARSGVTRDVKSGSTLGGFPAIPIKDWARQTALLSRMLKKGTSKK